MTTLPTLGNNAALRPLAAAKAAMESTPRPPVAGPGAAGTVRKSAELVGAATLSARMFASTLPMVCVLNVQASATDAAGTPAPERAASQVCVSCRSGSSAAAWASVSRANWLLPAASTSGDAPLVRPKMLEGISGRPLALRMPLVRATR